MPRLDLEDDEPDDATTVEGEPEATAIILKFLTRLAQSQEREGNVEVEISQWGSGGSAEPIYNVDMALGDNVDEICEQFMTEVVDDAMEMPPGWVRYRIRAEGHGSATIKLKVVQSDPDDIDDAGDLPNRKGLLTATMRHQHQTLRTILPQHDKLYSRYEKQLEAKDKRIAELESQQMANIKAYEEMVSGRHVREMELRKIEREEKQAEMITGALMGAVPMVAAKLFDLQMPAAMTGGDGQIDAVVGGLLDSLSPEQFAVLQKVFTPQQLQALAGLAQYVQQKRAQGQAPGQPEGAKS